MPYKDIKAFSPPENPDTPIWRYMDLTKFLALINSSALYFIRADKLVKLDPYEGLYTNTNVVVANLTPDQIDNLLISEIEKHGKESEQYLKAKEKIELISHDHRVILEASKQFRNKYFLNFWHMQEYESAAMWSLYARNSDGIAILSTFNMLKNAFEDNDDYNIYIGVVEYIDFAKSHIPVDHFFRPYLTKRKSFEHEKELRAIISFDTDNNIDGINVSINLEKLIKSIYIAPTAERWVVELLRSIINKSGINKPIHQSPLYDSPPLY